MNLPNFNRIALAVFLLSISQVQALELLEDELLSEEIGGAIAFLPENFKIVSDDTAYVRTLPSATAPAFPVPAAPNVLSEKAELLWYGIALAGNDGNTSDRVGNAITSWGTANNPWILKVESISKIRYDGVTAAVPIMSYYAPTYALNDGELKYAFWSDLVIRDRTTDTINGRFQTQSVWNGVSLNGSRFSMFQTTVDYTNSLHTAVAGTTAGSLGVAWLNRINSSSTGAFRFSAAETSQPAGANLTGVAAINSISTAAPTFNTVEGFYANDFDMNMVVGNLHYQPMIIGSTGDGTQNFQVEVTRIPNTPAVYNAFYRDYSNNSAAELAKMCTSTTIDCSAATHSELRIGKVEFKSPTGATLDMGSGIYEGMMIQHLKIRTLGL